MIALELSKATSPTQSLDSDAITKLIEQQDRMRRNMAEVLKQVDVLTKAIQIAEEKTQENERLKTETLHLRGQFSREVARAAQQATAPSVDSEEMVRLQDDLESLRGQFEAAEAEKASLEEELEFERELRRQTEEKLRDDVDYWFGEAEGLSDKLAKADLAIETLKLEVETAAERNTEAERELLETRAALEEARRLLSALASLAGPRQTAEPDTAPAPQPLSPEVTVTLSSVITGVRSIQEQIEAIKGLVGDLGEGQKRIEGAMESLQRPSPSDVPVATTTPDREKEGEDGEVPDSSLSHQDVTLYASQPLDEATNVVAAGEAGGLAETPYEQIDGREIEADAAETKQEERPWQEEFDRIEKAWLARRSVGDSHEESHFMGVVAALRRAGTYPSSDDELLQRLDALRQRVGDNFSYCILQYVLQRKMHRPTLDPLFVTVKMREAISKGVYCRRSESAGESSDGGESSE